MGAKFIPRDGQLLATPPMSMETTLYVFALAADFTRLQTLCDTYLNIGGPVEFRALLPLVTLYCSYEAPRPLTNPIGWCPERDFGFWVPVVAGHRDGDGGFVGDKIQMFTPYLWVDSGVPLIGGREVFGFPKELATLTMPPTTKDPADFRVDTLVIPTYGPDSECVQRELLAVGPVVPPGAPPATGWRQELAALGRGVELLADIVKLVEQLVLGGDELPLPTPALIMSAIELLRGQLPMVFLKQFPDVTASNDVCYQAIVETSIVITSDVKWSLLLGEYDASIWRYDSHRIVENLGLGPLVASGEANQVRSLLSGWVQFNSRIEGGSVVYRKA